MVKKAALSLALLTVLGAAVFADYYNGYIYDCFYVGANTSSTQLAAWAEIFEKDAPQLARLPKVPNSVLQVITHALEDYTLNVGDRFIIAIEKPDHMAYFVLLRITNRNGAYEYFAFYGSGL